MILGHTNCSNPTTVRPRERDVLVRVSTEQHNAACVERAVLAGTINRGDVVRARLVDHCESWAAGTHDGIRDAAGSRFGWQWEWSTDLDGCPNL